MLTRSGPSFVLWRVGSFGLKVLVFRGVGFVGRVGSVRDRWLVGLRFLDGVEVYRGRARAMITRRRLNSGTAACGLCAGGRLVPAVHHVCEKSSGAGGLFSCTGGQEATHATKVKQWTGTHRKVSAGPLLCVRLAFRCWGCFVALLAGSAAGWRANFIQLCLCPTLFESDSESLLFNGFSLFEVLLCLDACCYSLGDVVGGLHAQVVLRLELFEDAGCCVAHDWNLPVGLRRLSGADPAGV